MSATVAVYSIFAPSPAIEGAVADSLYALPRSVVPFTQIVLDAGVVPDSTTVIEPAVVEVL